MEKEEIGKKIKILRKTRGLTQQQIADKINHFNQPQESVLIITRKPFFRFCFGVLFGLFYFLVSFGIIFPKEMEPIIYHTLNVFFSLKDYLNNSQNTY